MKWNIAACLILGVGSACFAQSSTQAERPQPVPEAPHVPADSESRFLTQLLILEVNGNNPAKEFADKLRGDLRAASDVLKVRCDFFAPEQAKLILIAMLKKDQKDAAALIKSLPLKRRREIFSAFKTEEESSYLHEILKSLSPDQSVEAAPQLSQPSLSALAQRGLTETLRGYSGITVLSRPQIILDSDVPGAVTVGQETRLQYMERVAEGTFRLRQTPPIRLGLDVSLTVSEIDRADAAAQVRLSPIKLSLSAIEKRAPIEGVDLPIGVPSVAQRSVETALELALYEPGLIELPVADDKHVYLIVSVQPNNQDDHARTQISPVAP